MLRFLVTDLSALLAGGKNIFYTVQLSVLRCHICFERPSEVYLLFMVVLKIVNVFHKYVMVYSLT